MTKIVSFTLAASAALFMSGCVSVYQLTPTTEPPHRRLTIPPIVVNTVVEPHPTPPSPMVSPPAQEQKECDVDVDPELGEIPPIPSPSQPMFSDPDKIQELLIRHIAQLRSLLRNYQEVINERSVELSDCLSP